MPPFSSTPIFLDSETVAEQLRRTRQSNNLSLQEVSKKLNIKIEYLDALEKNQYNKLPKGVYGKTFLREYCDFLGLDYKSLVKKLEKNSPSSRGDVFERKVVSKRQLITLPLVIRNAIIGVLIISCLAYLVFLLRDMVSPPFLEIDHPPSDFITNEATINIMGRSEPESEVIINGQSVLLDTAGEFSREIFLRPGLNQIVITASKKYSQSATVTRQILFE